MAKDMGGTTAWASNGGTTHRPDHYHRDGTVVRKGPKGRSRSNEQCILGSPWPTVLDVVGDRIAYLLSQRHQCLTSALPRNTDPSFLPINIAQTKLHDVARTDGKT